jgi:glycosyltransferase involved in cell wall biosynthesis
MTCSGPGILLAHPHGNANVRQAAAAFAEAGLLREFWTGVAWNPDASLARAVPARFRRLLERRAVAPNLRPYLRLHPWREALRLAAGELHVPLLASLRTLSPNACHEALDRRVARALVRDAGASIGTVYAYDHGARDSFEVAQRQGLRRIYDLPIGYWRELERTTRQELEAWPAWSEIASAPDFRTPEYARKDDELALAEDVVVPSRFVARTLAAHAASNARIHVVPFGAPAVTPLDPAALERRAGPLRMLYVGSLDLRKGVPYLLVAAAALRGLATLTIVGRGGRGCVALRTAMNGVEHHDSLSHGEVLALMRGADVFLFPTLFEGMALVVLEAMSQGCAVVTTPNSGAEDVIVDGVNGFLVPTRSADALAATVHRLHDDRDLLSRVRLAAQATCREHTWARYRAALVSVVGRSACAAEGRAA